ncbi:hypothetical protein EIP86_010095 [Pleurotus ostreatoroseus]|nr:hypothetical protein EIP86_010095 [Pleurotus ostreatoroseus]
MRSIILAFLQLIPLALFVTPATAASSTCTLHASGSDDAPAFLAAAKNASCSTVSIPKGTTLNIETKMDMTELQNKHIDLGGTIQFAPNLPYWTGNAFFFSFQDQLAFWLLGGTNITLDGGGTLDGQGQAWYDAFAKNSSLGRPIILTVYQATDVTVENIRMINSPEWFNLVNEGEQVTYRNVTLSAVSTSKNQAKNTDGWDIFRSNNVIIENSNINNGDDCVSFKPSEYDIVENVTAQHIIMSNAQNGARIKAWAGKNVGSGIVKNITFTNFTETNVDNPVIIDQCYETSSSDCEKYPSNTLIQDIWFDSITGTSSGKEKAVVASLSCSPDGRCSSVFVNDLSITPPSKYGTASYTCANVVLSGSSADLFGTCSTS